MKLSAIIIAILPYIENKKAIWGAQKATVDSSDD